VVRVAAAASPPRPYSLTALREDSAAGDGPPQPGFGQFAGLLDGRSNADIAVHFSRVLRGEAPVPGQGGQGHGDDAQGDGTAEPAGRGGGAGAGGRGEQTEQEGANRGTQAVGHAFQPGHASADVVGDGLVPHRVAEHHTEQVAGTGNHEHGHRRGQRRDHREQADGQPVAERSQEHADADAADVPGPSAQHGHHEPADGLRCEQHPRAAARAKFHAEEGQQYLGRGERHRGEVGEVAADEVAAGPDVAQAAGQAAHDVAGGLGGGRHRGQACQQQRRQQIGGGVQAVRPPRAGGRVQEGAEQRPGDGAELRRRGQPARGRGQLFSRDHPGDHRVQGAALHGGRGRDRDRDHVQDGQRGTGQQGVHDEQRDQGEHRDVQPDGEASPVEAIGEMAAIQAGHDHRRGLQATQQAYGGGRTGGVSQVQQDDGGRGVGTHPAHGAGEDEPSKTVITDEGGSGHTRTRARQSRRERHSEAPRRHRQERAQAVA
jgi:hypothetical protein